MKFTVLAIADIHWGAMDPQLTYDNLQQVIKYIEEHHEELDMIVICGDYFDYRLQLNSKSALYAVRWFDDLFNTCLKYNCIIRVIKGTREHDNDQLEVLRASYESYHDDPGFCRIFNTCTSETLSNGIEILYCPDEVITMKEFDEKYASMIGKTHDIGFFHGNFDSILPSIERDRIINNNLPTLVFNTKALSSMIKGPMIAGHWHIATDDHKLHYVGSFDRWKFAEEVDKGFIIMQYDTETSKYTIKRIKNENARDFTTRIYVDDEVYKPEHFAEISADILRYLHNNPNGMLKVQYMLTQENEEALVNFNTLSRQFNNESHVKLELVDLVKKEAKKKIKKKIEEESKKYDYIFTNDLHRIPAIIQQFIKESKQVDLTEEEILRYIQKYLEAI